jgi:hypothetical protein
MMSVLAAKSGFFPQPCHNPPFRLPHQVSHKTSESKEQRELCWVFSLFNVASLQHIRQRELGREPAARLGLTAASLASRDALHIPDAGPNRDRQENRAR